MPALKIETNLNLDGVDLDPVTSELKEFLSSAFNASKNLVMIIVKGSAHISFGGSKDGAAAFVEVYAMSDPIDRALKRKIIAGVGRMMELHLSIPSSRCFCNVVDLALTRPKL